MNIFLVLSLFEKKILYEPPHHTDNFSSDFQPGRAHPTFLFSKLGGITPCEIYLPYITTKQINLFQVVFKAIGSKLKTSFYLDA